MSSRSEYMQRYRDANKEEKAEYNRRYHIAHREEILERTRKHRIEHREEILEYGRKYRAEHREETRAKRRKHHAEHRKECNEYYRERRYAAGAQPMSENRSCPLFLGVYVAEKLLSHLFKSVTRMPLHNPGYDFKCGQGFLVDAKSACGHTRYTGTTSWMFHIGHNTTADYFLCIAFDNRRDLNPLHYWLIPGEVLSHLVGASISETTLDKWAKYEKPIDEAICCCNTMKGAI